MEFILADIRQTVNDPIGITGVTPNKSLQSGHYYPSTPFY